MEFPRVTVVVLNWNRKEDTCECLDSLFESAYPSYNIVVVDNGSTDGSVDLLRRRYASAALLALETNVGFAAGNNRGIEVALRQGAEVVFLLNNDTTVAPDCLMNLARAARELPKDSVLGPKILYYDRPETVWHFGSRWDQKALELTAVARNEPSERWAQRLRVDHIIGCAMWIPRRALEKVGMFDERFFLNYEETDWCFRAARAGIPLFVIPDATVWHKISSSFSSSAQMVYFLERNRLLWIEKNFSGLQRWRLVARKEIPPKVKLLARLLRRCLAYGLFFLARRRSKLEYYGRRVRLNYAAVLGWCHYLIRRFGDCPAHLLKS